MGTTSSLNIGGLGPRLLGDYRHAPGILPLVRNLVENQLPIDVQLTNIGLQQLNENLQKCLLDSQLDYLVLESAPADEQQSAGRTQVSPVTRLPFRSNPSPLYFDHLADLWGWLRGELFSLIEYFAGVDPMTPMLDYLAAIVLVAAACKSAGASAIVLLPLARDSRHSRRSISAYKNALRDLAKVQDFMLVDCFDAPDLLPEPSAPSHDQRYLSPKGQQALGRAIADTIVTDVLTRSRRVEPRIFWPARGQDDHVPFSREASAPATARHCLSLHQRPCD